MYKDANMTDTEISEFLAEEGECDDAIWQTNYFSHIES